MVDCYFCFLIEKPSLQNPTKKRRKEGKEEKKKDLIEKMDKILELKFEIT